MTPRVYTLATGGWVVVRDEKADRFIGGHTICVGESAADAAAMLRALADDIERAAKDGPRFEGDAE